MSDTTFSFLIRAVPCLAVLLPACPHIPVAGAHPYPSGTQETDRYRRSVNNNNSPAGTIGVFEVTAYYIIQGARVRVVLYRWKLKEKKETKKNTSRVWSVRPSIHPSPFLPPSKTQRKKRQRRRQPSKSCADTSATFPLPHPCCPFKQNTAVRWTGGGEEGGEGGPITPKKKNGNLPPPPPPTAVIVSFARP